MEEVWGNLYIDGTPIAGYWMIDVLSPRRILILVRRIAYVRNGGRVTYSSGQQQQ